MKSKSNTGRSRRWARNTIAELDPRVDDARITHLSAEVRYGDPVLTAALYTVAFLRQMAVPSIAAVVHRGGRGPIMRSTRKRNDDTMVFFGEFMQNGHSSERGRAAIERLNEIHAPFPITNDQSLYTLASLSFEAARIPSFVGVDLLTDREKEANLRFWRGVGKQMGLHDIPETYDEFWDWSCRYERDNWAFSAGGVAVAQAMIDDYAARWLPPRLQFLGRAFVAALCEDELLDVHGLPRPKRGVRPTIGVVLRLYAIGRRILPDPQERSWTDYFGSEYGSCPHLAEVGYRGRRTP
jgi:hypothetical protein